MKEKYKKSAAISTIIWIVILVAFVYQYGQSSIGLILFGGLVGIVIEFIYLKVSKVVKAIRANNQNTDEIELLVKSERILNTRLSYAVAIVSVIIVYQSTMAALILFMLVPIYIGSRVTANIIKCLFWRK